MIIKHYLFFANFSIYLNVLKDKNFNAEQYYLKEFRTNRPRPRILLCQESIPVFNYLCSEINEYKFYTLFCEESKSKVDGIFKSLVYISPPHKIKMCQIIHISELLHSLINDEGAQYMAAQDVGKIKSDKNITLYYIRSKILRNSLECSVQSHGMDAVYKLNVSVPNGYRKFHFKCPYSKELHNRKKRSVSNEDYYTNYDLLFLSDWYPLSPHMALSAKEVSPQSEIMSNSSIQNYFGRQKVRKIVAENSHLTLNCPETTMDSNVQWYKNNERLNSSFRRNMADSEIEPHITIDAYNSLYILQATKNEEGVYTCYVNDKPFQTYLVIVVSKSKLLNEEFFKYSIYLGFVLSLTITCYCAGICVAWHQRSSFADPLR